MSTNQPRVAMITGGNSGIGFVTASKLAERLKYNIHTGNLCIQPT